MFLLAASDDRFVRGNQNEAALWCLIAAALAWYAWRQSGQARRLCVIGAATFLIFGISDLVEIHTGAWWRPWWLAVWKGSCVLTMVWLLWADSRRRKLADSKPNHRD